MQDINFHQHLAWFLGPKAENANLLEELILQVLRDYTYWRKNYFPGDPILINKTLKGQFEQEQDLLDTRLAELMAQLRRNFPFYSPRYIAHELSDTLLAANIGYFAGMLFNPNNVTPEAAPVTAELEIEVCNSILSMLGYTPPPTPPRLNEDAKQYYAQKSKDEFGWAHLTSGGTIANIEALWVARQVKYFPLAVKEIAAKYQLELTIKLPDSAEDIPITQVDNYQLLLLKSNESIYLLAKYLEALRSAKNIVINSDLSKLGWKYLEESEYCITRGIYKSFSDFQPVILVAGSRHYSVSKAANVLGIGQANIVYINTDQYFRMDVGHLEESLMHILQEKKVPLCVIATAGTTEEGAVDPIHDILDLRLKFEREHKASFWLHIDAAWGGFIRSLFRLEPEDYVEAAAGKISKILKLKPPHLSSSKDKPYLINWHNQFTEKIVEVALYSKKEKALSETKINAEDTVEDVTIEEESSTESTDSISPQKDKIQLSDNNEQNENDIDFAEQIKSTMDKMSNLLASGNYEKYLHYLSYISNKFEGRSSKPKITSLKPGLNAINNWVGDYVSTKMKIDKEIVINWPDRNVASAYLAFPKADSITVDPHKMGYAPYPAGCIAFKNDRIRSFILQHAPYITAAEHNALIHLPPRHIDLNDSSKSKPSIVTESFSPFMLEGSRPGAVAAGLWLAFQVTPLVPKRHGLIVRASVLAARLLYEWITRWDDWCKINEIKREYDFFPLSPLKPDTNLVNFVIKPKIYNSIVKTNFLTSQVYETFSIQAEIGDREYSYSQPFFLSNTKISQPDYPVSLLKPFFGRCGYDIKEASEDYMKEGLVVLRATVMNPYIMASREIVEQDFIQLFVEELGKSASIAFPSIIG